jgi:broad specificity phosphatase PhoE
MFLGNPRTGGDLQIFPGLTRQEIAERFPGCVAPEAITDEGWWTGGYEDISGCFGRATRVARRLRRRAQTNLENGTQERLALVTHGTFLDTLLKAFFNQLPDRGLFYQHYNTGITRLDFMPDGAILLRFLNRTQHLPSKMLSM